MRLVDDGFTLICVDVSQIYFSMSQVEDLGDGDHGVGDDLWIKTLWSMVVSKTTASMLPSLDGVQMTILWLVTMDTVSRSILTI